MQLSRKSIKHLILGLAACGSLAMAAPMSATHAAPARYQHATYFPCSSYHGSYWGYSYGYYNGADITFRLQGQDGYDGYDYGTVWYRGYYPDDEYWTFFSAEPTYYDHHYDGFQYRCFAPQVTSDPSPSNY